VQKSEILLEQPSSGGSSPQETLRAALFLMKMIQQTSSIQTESAFIQRTVDVLSDEEGIAGVFIGGPGLPLEGKSKLETKKQDAIRTFLANLITSGIDSISPELLESLPEMNSVPVTIVSSPLDGGTRILIVVFGIARSIAMPLLNTCEPWFRLRIQSFRSAQFVQRMQSCISGLQDGSRNMIQNLLKQGELIPTLLEDARRILRASSCAILFPVDESRNSYYVAAQTGKQELSLPIPQALFARTFADYESNGDQVVLHQAGDRENYMLAPLIQRKSVSGILLIVGEEYRGDECKCVAGIFGDLFSLANESTTLFQRFASSQTEWENTFDSIADPLYIIDNNFRLKKINKSLASYSMKSIKVPLDPHCYKYLFDQNSICPWCPVPKSMETGAPEMVETPLFSTGVWQIQSFPYTDKEEKRMGSINVLRDITVLNRMQEQLIETEKLASTGKLISGVAHEVRNPLFGISATVRALANELKGAPQDIQPYLDIVMSETTRLNRLMEDLLNYTRPVKIDKNPSDIGELVQEVIDHFQHLPEGQSAKFSVIAGDRIPAMNMDRNKMKQVLFNLFENGIQHGLEEPRVDVFLQLLSLSQPPEIHLVVKDNGSGITNENLTRVFDPFFTTRQKGTGLGLSIVRKVIHDHGGRISVESHPGIGTTFRITLPVTVTSK